MRLGLLPAPVVVQAEGVQDRRGQQDDAVRVRRVEVHRTQAEVEGVAEDPLAHPVQPGVQHVPDGQADRAQRPLDVLGPGVGAPPSREQPVGEPGATGDALRVVSGQRPSALTPGHPYRRRTGERDAVRSGLEVHVVQDRHRQASAAQFQQGRRSHSCNVPTGGDPEAGPEG